MAQIPHADENGLKCPLWQQPMHMVCHTCPLWAKFRGVERNTGREIDSWHCSLEMLPHLLIENMQQTRGAAAATETLRNVIAGAITATQREREFNDFVPPVARIE